MDVVGGDQLDVMFVCEFDHYLVDFLLFGIGGTVGIRVVCFVPLHFQVIIFSKQIFKPFDRLFRLVDLAVHDVLWNLSSQAGRTDDQIFMVFFEQFVVDTRTSVEAFGPRNRYHLDQVLITVHVLCQYDQVVTATVFLEAFIMPAVAGAIAFAAYNGFEYFFLFSFY